MTRFLLYAARWQLSGLVLAPVLWAMTGIGPWASAWATVVANAIGACVFYQVDRWILKGER